VEGEWGKGGGRVAGKGTKWNHIGQALAQRCVCRGMECREVEAGAKVHCWHNTALKEGREGREGRGNRRVFTACA